jgi:segregation and condensation protein A
MEKQGEINFHSEPSVTQDQVHDLLFSKQIDWQEIIYDLINTEQLNPWDINILVLTEKYFQRIQELEEADFFISSKVLYAASLLLRIKSEILLNKYVKSIDDILFGRKEELRKPGFERMELDEDIPELIPRSPLPRFKKVTLKELMESLNKAITTENRRIKKEIVNKNALIESSISLPRRNFSLKDKIKEILDKLADSFSSNENYKKISFSEFTKKNHEEMINSFSPLLHLENQKKIWLEQKNHFEEIYIWEKESYWKNNGHPFQDLMDELKSGTYQETPVSDEEFEKFGEKEEESP